MSLALITESRRRQRNKYEYTGIRAGKIDEEKEREIKKRIIRGK
jgi:hypothetical protein